jgi:preprotein translocase subunit YajC
MSRLIVLILLVVVILGGVYFLSTVPQETSTRTIETDVQSGNAS